VPLSQETRELFPRNPHGKDLIRLNRLLLEDAYRQEIAKRPIVEPCVSCDGKTICYPNWTPVTNAPYTFADHFYLDAGIPNGIKFYRLICTNCVPGAPTR
jgi:hypothetical protein